MRERGVERGAVRGDAVAEFLRAEGRDAAALGMPEQRRPDLAQQAVADALRGDVGADGGRVLWVEVSAEAK